MGNSHLWKSRRTLSLSHNSQQCSHHISAGLRIGRDCTGLCKCLELWGEGAQCGGGTGGQNNQEQTSDLLHPSPVSEGYSISCRQNPHSFSPLRTRESLPRFKNLRMVAPCTTQTQQLSKSWLYGAKHAKEAPQAEGCVTSVGLPLAGHLFKGSEYKPWLVNCSGGERY